MKTRAWGIVVLIVVPGGASAQSPVPPLVDHPAATRTVHRTSAAWRGGVGGYGETLARVDLASRGYTVQTVKLPSNQGIDLVALKRAAGGHITDVRLVEVKTHYGSAAKLSETKLGPQMSRQWLADRLKRLRTAGPEGRKLARDVYQFRKATGVPIDRLGELHDVNLRSERYTVRDPVTRAVRDVRPVRGVLTRVADRSSDPGTARWAGRHLAKYELITKSRMQTWATAVQPRARAAASALRSGARLPVKAVAALTRAAGPIGLLVSATTDGDELYTLTIAHRRGTLSGREYTVEVTRLVGGWAGASVGGYSGGKLGAAVGMYFGPWGAFAGGIIGTGVGGTAGYFGGSYLSEQIVTTWYASLDREVIAGVTDWLVNGPRPVEVGDGDIE